MASSEPQDNVINHAREDLKNIPASVIAEPGPPSWAERIGNAFDAVMDQAVMPALEKLIPQGAAELAQGLYTGNAYVPYGPTDNPVSMDGGVQAPSIGPPAGWETAGGPTDIQGPAIQGPEIGPVMDAANSVQSPEISSPMQTQDFRSMLEEYAAQASMHGKEQDRGMER